MTSTHSRSGHPSKRNDFWAGIGRAAGGAVFFSLPLLMTMEMWQLGYYMSRVPLIVFMLLMFPLLVGLDRVSGFKDSSRWIDDVADALLAYAVGLIISAGVLALFNIIHLGMSLREILGKITLQSIPASFGAVIASSQLWGQQEEQQQRERKAGGYGRDLFLMLAGAMFFAFNVAPTEEMIVIAFRLTAWHALALVAVTIAAMHAFVYGVNFSGSARVPPHVPSWSLVLRFAVPGYAISLVVSAYVLWTFGRYQDHAPIMMVREAVVLGFPAGIGAAAARLVI